MDTQISVLGLLKKARDLVDAGRYAGIIEVIGALKNEASGPRRDLAYYAVLETVSASKGEAGISALSAASRDASLALLDATIRRISSKLH
ncbi:MAG TPA: hypothetical protein VEZ24_18605 [Microvirga sp.]|nr:hypothetical protein [Microvirga sp.]